MERDSVVLVTSVIRVHSPKNPTASSSQEIKSCPLLTSNNTEVVKGWREMEVVDVLKSALQACSLSGVEV